MDAAIGRVHDAGKWDSDCWDVEVRYRWLDEIDWASAGNPDYSVGVTDADDTEDGPFLVSLRRGHTRPTTLEHELVHIHLACSRRDLYENWNHIGDEWKGMNR